MEINKTSLLFLLITICFFAVENDSIAQSATESSDGVIRLKSITIKARVRRPTIQFTPSRIKPVFNIENNSIESMSNQVKERPKGNFYIRRDSEVPGGLDADKIIQRVRN